MPPENELVATNMDINEMHVIRAHTQVDLYTFILCEEQISGFVKTHTHTHNKKNVDHAHTCYSMLY